MPDKAAIKKAKELKKEGASPSTQAGEFARAEIDKIRDGEHGARSTEQAIAIGLSEARRAGVDLPLPKKGKYDGETRRHAELDRKAGMDHPGKKPNPKRSAASLKALKKEPKGIVSKKELSDHAKEVAAKKTPEERSVIAKKAARTRKKNEKTTSE